MVDEGDAVTTISNGQSPTAGWGKVMVLTEDGSSVDYAHWDWIPGAASEVERYLGRLLSEAAVKAHDVSARAKTIKSFRDKCDRKAYPHPLQDVTDTVAVRIITYSITDRGRAEQLIRERFQIKAGEDRCPGEDRPDPRRGYDCQHFVVTGEKPGVDSGWLVAGGELAKYFDSFGGLEIQVRTVAAHAWAEFEHARRYKGPQYKAISEQDRGTIDQLFAAASDARRALDETFVAIDRVLANPTSPGGPLEAEPDAPERLDDDGQDGTNITPARLGDLLARRFPDDSDASEKGMQFACDLVEASGIRSIEELTDELGRLDSDRVRRLMDTATPVTRVRRMDDELLTLFGANYIERTKDVGISSGREQQLQWRFDRVRDKVPDAGYAIYELVGSSCPSDLLDVRLTAARVVREVAKLVAEHEGRIPEVAGAISASPDNLLPSARAKPITAGHGETLWVATNLNRRYAETLITEILSGDQTLDLQVTRSGSPIA